MSKLNFNQTKKSNLGIKDYRVWKLKTNLMSNNILGAIDKSKSQVKNLTESLNDGERHTNKKRQSIQSLNKLKSQNENQTYASDHVKKIMGDVGKMVVNIKKSEDDLSKENVDALLETKKQLKKSEIIEESNKILKIKEKEYKLCLEGKIKKPPNYRFLSDGYRKQVNKIFMDYNPLSHLVNIRKLRKNSPEIDNQFKLQMDDIDEYIKNFKLAKTNNNFNNISKRKNAKKFVINQMAQTLPTAATNTMTDGYNTAKIGLSSKTIFGKKLKKNKDTKRKFPDKENREIELNLLKNACDQISTSISPKTVNNYFNSYEKLKDMDMNLQKNTYFKNMGMAQKILREIQENLYIKKMEEDILNKKKYTLMENDKLVEKFKSLKLSVLNEIDEQEKKQNKNLNLI